MSNSMGGPPRVFISYTHDSSEHMHRILELSIKLRSEGIDCNIDQYIMNPTEGWPRWMEKEISISGFVLVACTEIYNRRFSGAEKSGVGLGSTWEGAIITQSLYEAQGKNDKFIPIIFSSDDAQHIPTCLRGTTHYNLSKKDEYTELYRRLTDQPRIIKPELGSLREMLAEVSTSQSSVGVSTTTTSTNYSSLILIHDPNGTSQFLYSKEIKIADTVVISLISNSPKQSAFLNKLKGESDPIGLAYNLTALSARVKNVVQITQAGKEIFNIELIPERTDYGAGAMELAYSGFHPDKIAEMRARRILLDEKAKSWDIMLEVLVRGQSTPIQIKESLFPMLFSKLGNEAEYFLAIARLFAVLQLRLSGVIEHVHRLELKLIESCKLSVAFEGQRPRKYFNVEPPIIKVEGLCNLK